MVWSLIFSQSDIFKSRWHTENVGPEGTDLQIPNSPWVVAFMVRRLIFSRSDSFKRRWRTQGVGPEGADLQIPNSPSWPSGPTLDFFAERQFQKALAHQKCRA